MKISKSKGNRKTKKKKKKKKKDAFHFDSIKNSFWVHKVSGIKILFPNFYKKLFSGFEKSSLYFTSHMKIFKSKCNRKPPQNPFNFESFQNSFRVHRVTGIKMLFTRFHKKL